MLFALLASMWLPALAQAQGETTFGALSLELNIPAFRLDVREGNAVVRSFPVAIGMRRYATPVGQFEITRITWNPWWYPPAAQWAERDSSTKPGPTNPMGKVKLRFDGPLQLHGTPLVSSLGRAASHGCIRLRNRDAIELARMVQRFAAPGISDETTDSLVATWKKTRVVDLVVAVPVMIVYHVAEVRDSVLALYPDVYRRNADPHRSAIEALLVGQYDTTGLDGEILRRLTRRARTRAVTIPLSAVIAGPDAPRNDGAVKPVARPSRGFPDIR